MLVVAAAFSLLGTSSLGLTGSWLAGAAHAADGPTGSIQVHVSGDRDQATNVRQPVAGVKFNAYADSGLTSIAGSCTTDATGECTIPDLSVAPSGTVYWVGEASAQSPFNAVLQGTAQLSPSDSLADRPYVEPVTVRDGATTDTHDFIVARDNPALPNECGLNIALLFDVSNSLQGNATILQDAGKAFVDALAGTPSNISVAHFAGTASTDLGATSVGTSAGAQQVRDAIDSIAVVREGTNWDAGFREVAKAGADVVIVLTDGNPSLYV
jgi:hypothetical protein